ncbi:glycosyltransferase family protein [Algihabitans albus]|uniref:hypothetical protein n=1 Tax=Algihabitans albus TaxID=2164067 RepID=UPI001ABC24C7|nr:hypothetical protein [Algihabitans albus]
MTYVTTNPEFGPEVEADAAARRQPKPRFYAISDANRWQKLRLLWALLKLFAILLRVRPHTIITTGAAPGYLALRLGRLMGARTAWVDSIANAEELSLSGRKAGNHADVWLTQWEDLASARGPQYRGSVL